MSPTDFQGSKFKVNGHALRRRRQQLGLTQIELAEMAGYTDRLIRKAEGFGSLNRDSLSDIAEALSQGGFATSINDLTCDPLRVAQDFIKAFETCGPEMVPHVAEFLAPDFVFECAGDPAGSPLAGKFHGAAGLQKWLDRFHVLFGRSARTPPEFEYFLNGNHVLVRYVEIVVAKGVTSPPIWVNLYFDVELGQIRFIRDEYDTLAIDSFMRSVGLDGTWKISLGDSTPVPGLSETGKTNCQ